MLATLAENHWPPEISSNTDSKSGPLTTFSVEEARLHRQRGIPLNQYMGLTKYYRRTYLELVADHFPSGEDADRYRRFIDLFFDNAEISICVEWERQDSSADLRQAAATNRQLINEKNRYLTIFESLNEPVIIVDDEGTVTNLNLAASLLFDGSAVSGQGYYGDNGDHQPNSQIAALLKHAGSATELEHQLETRRGLRTFQVKLQRMLDVSEKFTGTVMILTDITDFRAAQRSSDAANRAKSAFLATMSHEIRTPINGILGIGQLLQDAPSSEMQRSYVDALLSSGELLLDLVNDVLDYSKLEAGETELQPAIFSPRDMVERIALLSTGEAQRKGLQLTVEIAEGCPPNVRADGSKIQRILLNLINNAVKFTSEGSVSISIDAADERLDFTVRDTGPGIPEADHERVFEPFVQHATMGAEAPLGTGLGLAICRRLADVLSADLTVEGAEDGGTVFRLSCPVTAVDAPGEDLPTASSTVRALDILLVEDNAINAMVTEGFLEKDGHCLVTVTSGEAALEALNANAYELVLMDIRLQGHDGFETIRQIRASSDPSIRDVPILVVTADQTDKVAYLFANSGANAFQAKPFSRDELRRAISWAIGSAPVNLTFGETLSEADQPVLDVSVIAGHREAIGLERSERIISIFLETAVQHKTALSDAAKSGNSDAMVDIAHTVRSAAEMTGLRKLAGAADVAERRILAGHDAGSLIEMAETLNDLIDKSSVTLRELALPFDRDQIEGAGS